MTHQQEAMKSTRVFLIFLSSAFNLLGTEPEQKKPYCYYSCLDGIIGAPPYWCVSSSISIGLPSPYGLGIGFAPIEFWGYFSKENPGIIGLLLLHLYYVPYANWHESGYAKKIIYSYFSKTFAAEGFMGGRTRTVFKVWDWN